VLLVIDGNTGQNALAQVKAFDAALGLTGLIVTKLDGTAKGGVLAAIAQEKPIPVYFIGVGEKLEDLETFNAREFALALLGQARSRRPLPPRGHANAAGPHRDMAQRAA
jgi:fused signal recognition particle receptor